MLKMRHGKNLKPSDIILATIQFTDTNEVKIRPAIVLFEEHDNTTSNLSAVQLDTNV